MLCSIFTQTMSWNYFISMPQKLYSQMKHYFPQPCFTSESKASNNWSWFLCCSNWSFRSCLVKMSMIIILVGKISVPWRRFLLEVLFVKLNIYMLNSDDFVFTYTRSCFYIWQLVILGIILCPLISLETIVFLKIRQKRKRKRK